MRLRFLAPWSRLLTTFTAVLVVAEVVIVWAGAVAPAAALGAVLALTGAFAVRGYVVEPEAVVILRPGWATRLDLRDLETVRPDPDALTGAWRSFGIGGPFALVGWFRSKRLGRFRAYATDPGRAVVLRWPDRAVVVSPDDPVSFATAVEAAAERF